MSLYMKRTAVYSQISTVAPYTGTRTTDAPHKLVPVTATCHVTEKLNSTKSFVLIFFSPCVRNLLLENSDTEDSFHKILNK